MGEFFKALWNPDLAFLRYALFLGLIGSIPLGAVGTFVVARRISYLAAAIAHSALGGIGVALYCRAVFGWEWLHPMLGALLVALIAAGLIGWVLPGRVWLGVVAPDAGSAASGINRCGLDRLGVVAIAAA